MGRVIIFGIFFFGRVIIFKLFGIFVFEKTKTLEGLLAPPELATVFTEKKK